MQNIKNHPRLSFEVDSNKYSGIGRIIDRRDEPELAKKVSELMETKYEWSDGLIVELRPEPGVS